MKLALEWEGGEIKYSQGQKGGPSYVQTYKYDKVGFQLVEKGMKIQQCCGNC